MWLTDVRDSYTLLLMWHHILHKVQAQIYVSVYEDNMGFCVQKDEGS